MDRVNGSGVLTQQPTELEWDTVKTELTKRADGLPAWDNPSQAQLYGTLLQIAGIIAAGCVVHSFVKQTALSHPSMRILCTSVAVLAPVGGLIWQDHAGKNDPTAALKRMKEGKDEQLLQQLLPHLATRSPVALDTQQVPQEIPTDLTATDVVDESLLQLRETGVVPAKLAHQFAELGDEAKGRFAQAAPAIFTDRALTETQLPWDVINELGDLREGTFRPYFARRLEQDPSVARYELQARYFEESFEYMTSMRAVLFGERSLTDIAAAGWLNNEDFIALLKQDAQDPEAFAQRWGIDWFRAFPADHQEVQAVADLLAHDTAAGPAIVAWRAELEEARQAAQLRLLVMDFRRTGTVDRETLETLSEAQKDQFIAELPTTFARRIPSVGQLASDVGYVQVYLQPTETQRNAIVGHAKDYLVSHVQRNPGRAHFESHFSGNRANQFYGAPGHDDDWQQDIDNIWDRAFADSSLADMAQNGWLSSERFINKLKSDAENPAQFLEKWGENWQGVFEQHQVDATPIQDVLVAAVKGQIWDLAQFSELTPELADLTRKFGEEKTLNDRLDSWMRGSWTTIRTDRPPLPTEIPEVCDALIRVILNKSPSDYPRLSQSYPLDEALKRYTVGNPLFVYDGFGGDIFAQLSAEQKVEMVVSLFSRGEAARYGELAGACDLQDALRAYAIQNPLAVFYSLGADATVGALGELYSRTSQSFASSLGGAGGSTEGGNALALSDSLDTLQRRLPQQDRAEFETKRAEGLVPLMQWVVDSLPTFALHHMESVELYQPELRRWDRRGNDLSDFFRDQKPTNDFTVTELSYRRTTALVHLAGPEPKAALQQKVMAFYATHYAAELASQLGITDYHQSHVEIDAQLLADWFAPNTELGMYARSYADYKATGNAVTVYNLLYHAPEMHKLRNQDARVTWRHPKLNAREEHFEKLTDRPSYAQVELHAWLQFFLTQAIGAGAVPPAGDSDSESESEDESSDGSD